MNGKVTHVSLSKDDLCIEGLLLINKPMEIQSFKVLFKGIEFSVKPLILSEGKETKRFQLNIPLNHQGKIYSKQAKGSSFPKAFKSFRQGFAYLFPRLFAKVYRRKVKANYPLIKITPLLQDGNEGNSFYGLANVLLPIPLERDNRKIGGGNFLETSSEFLGLMIEQAELKKKDHILDIGCGLGRMAYALVYYLDPDSRYEGFDIMPSLVARAQKFISPHFPHFHFRHVNVWNKFYHPQGTEKPSSFRFPYEDASFHFALLTSVFTHMLTADIRHYLSEIYRILAEKGRCLFSCFLMTDESKKLIKEQKSTQQLIHPFGDHCYVFSVEYPEAAIGYEKSFLLDLIKAAGFHVKKICPGSWCGRTNALNYQDIIVIEKVIQGVERQDYGPKGDFLHPVQ